MILSNFFYEDLFWKVDTLTFNKQNLVVGKNAVGKSKLLSSLSKVARIVSNKYPLAPNDSFRVALTMFDDPGNSFYYRFEWNGEKVMSEMLTTINLEADRIETVMERDEDHASLLGDAFNPPSDTLAVHVRRDVVKYPYIEQLISWAENLVYISFNELDWMGAQTRITTVHSSSATLYDMVKKLKEHDKIHVVLDRANQLGYDLEYISPEELGTYKTVIFREKGLIVPLMDDDLSKGMFRTIYLLAYMEYIALSDKPTTLLIDDLCEGLDYDRSTKLGKMLFEFCEQNEIQLIASSNDSFLMDAVDLQYWSILQREDNVVSSVNYISNMDLFNDFKFTGLSNFDLFSSDFIKRHNTNKK